MLPPLGVNALASPTEHVVSRCGLYCDTCPAFQNGLCPGCPHLERGECVVRECAERKRIASCYDCELDSCHHFEAYAARRRLMRQRTKALLARSRAQGGAAGAARGGCGAGGCGGCGGCSAGGSGCSGCASAGACGAARALAALAELI